MKEMITAGQIEECMLIEKDDAQAKHLMRFFKTAPGDYGEGDRFIGLKVPHTRLIIKESRLRVSLDEIRKLLYSQWHEIRLAGFLLLVEEMKANVPKKSDKEEDVKSARRAELARFYLSHARQANNWDLVDMSCPKILGTWLRYSPENVNILYRLAESDNLWEQRIAMVTNWMLIRDGIFKPTIDVATKLLDHPHDLIHKAVGWMLREMGKRDEIALEEYLSCHHGQMHRTTLRYAIEKLPEDRRRYWLKK